MKISAILAMSSNRVIGINNSLPWNLPADMKHFKELTMGHPVIMGRNTHKSIGRVLPGRLNVVVTSIKKEETTGCCMYAGSVQEALYRCSKHDEVFIIGGQKLYESTLHLVDRFYITIIEHEFSGDAFFPELSPEWTIKKEEAHTKDEQNKYNYKFLTLEKE